MRYLMQFGLMLGDILLLIALIIVWNTMPVWFSILMTFLVVRAWKESGAFMSWQPKWIKRFLANAKELGL